MFCDEYDRSTSAQPPDPQFIVGQDQQGRWLAVETRHLGGGLFKSRQDALRYADFETGHRPGAVELAKVPLRLSF